MRAILFPILALLFAADAYAQSTVVMGRLLTADGTPAAQGHIALVRSAGAFPRGVLLIEEPDSAGRFELVLDAPRLHLLRFSAPAHERLEQYVYSEPGDTVEVDIRLGRLGFAPDRVEMSYALPPIHSVKRTGWAYVAVYTNRTERWTKVTMDVTGDEPVSLTLAAPGDSLAYDVHGMARRTPNSKGAWTNHPGVGGTTLTLEGNYFTLIATPDDSVRVTFDPASWPREASAPDVRWIRGSEHAKQFHDVSADVQRRRERHDQHRKEQLDAGVSEFELKADWSSDLRDVQRAAKRATDPFERAAWTMAYLKMLSSAEFNKPLTSLVTREEAEEMMRALPPDSPLWVYTPEQSNGLVYAASGPPDGRDEAEGDQLLPMPPTPLDADERLSTRYRDYAMAMAEHPDTTASHRWLQLGMRYAAMTDDYVTYSQYSARFFERFAGTPLGQIELRRLKYDDKTPPGTLLPSFAVPSLDDPDRMIRSEDFRGNPVYVSFWATWCGPCLPKLKRLADLHGQYGDAGFQIVSISTDFRPEDAIAYRDEFQPMPWANGFIGAGEEAQEGLLAQLGVLGIPHGILVDAEGYVVGVDKGGDLEAAVAALMRQE